ncbi:MAG TPA: acyl-CoA dehydrogenase family protein [Alcanivoracaceae bacterium]|nr:acyl-CoA dehydrogenase family protein [Alcanivoracaceae bacterium]
MDFSYSPRTEEYRQRVLHFMDTYVLPHNQQWHEEVAAGQYPLALINDLKALAHYEGLWNLFLPSLREDQPGERLSNVEYAPVAEIMGRLPWAAEVFNCSAPDSGNIELLQLFASEAQTEQWLNPLLRGEIRSCFAMSEPDVASSDATNMQTTIRREGDDYVINGRKWFISGVGHPNCRVAIVLGESSSNTDEGKHGRHSMVLVPLDTEGVDIVRDIPIMHHHSPEGHGEMVFRNVRVPASALLGEEGAGFAMAQARLGPGRIHHCMRSIGQCEVALELMRERAIERRSFGQYLSEYANISEWIAHSRMEIDQARLLVLQAAWQIDQHGASAARTSVSAIKVVVAQLQTRVLDRAMQVFGAMGLSPDTPLSFLWTWGRAMRVLDGPDEVHLRTVARNEYRLAREHLGESTLYFPKTLR